ncbi:MAG: response regulator [Desulfatibacillaceae bacterium]
MEDSEVSRRVAVSILGQFEIEPDVAVNGHEACEAARSRAYDLVLMDCQLPGMDGHEATLAIRGPESASAGTPIVAMTASTTPEEREHCFTSGMDDYVAKPLQIHEVAAILEKYIGAEFWNQPSTGEVPVPADVDERLAFFGVHAGDGDQAALLEGCLAEDMNTRLPALTRALDARDFAAIRRHGHALKGSYGYDGPAAFHEIVASLEDAAGDEDAATCADLLDLLADAFREALAHLRDEAGRR